MKILSEMAGFFYFYTMNKGLTQNRINKTFYFSNGIILKILTVYLKIMLIVIINLQTFLKERIHV